MIALNEEDNAMLWMLEAPLTVLKPREIFRYGSVRSGEATCCPLIESQKHGRCRILVSNAQHKEKLRPALFPPFTLSRALYVK